MFLGIDTSCYTTSLALVDEGREMMVDKRIVLPVPVGKQGLQQSTALFYHLRNLPEMLEEVLKVHKGRKIRGVAASFRPCPREDSYLPVFTAGSALARNIAVLLGIPLVATSHQEGHLVAGLWSAQADTLQEFLMLHLSGGTTELLQVKRIVKNPLQYDIRVLGRSADIHAGQLVDRVGVALGLPFPCGKHLEKLAEGYDKVAIPSSRKGYMMSFSGAETLAKKYIRDGAAPGAVARAVEHCIAMTVEKVIRQAVESTGLKDVLVVGGVAANGYIRQRLKKRLEHPAVGAKLLFPAREYCSDSAVGTGLIAHSMIY